MKERVVDWIVGWLIADRVSGWNTKLGAAATIVLSVSGVLIVVAQSILLAKAKHYDQALVNLNSEAMWAALAGLGITKQVLGVRVAVDKAKVEAEKQA